jgi:hypothetical protein
MAREFLYIVQESAYGTPVASPTLGTNAIYIRLDEGNAFGMVGDPVFFEIMYGGGVANKAILGSDQIECVGALKTKLYGSQAVFLSNWYGQKINAGQTTPWVTTEPPGDLVSCSVYHAVTRSDGTVKRIRFAGVKVESIGIEHSRESKVATLTLSLRGQKYVGNTYDSSTDPTSTEFPAPADTAYPTDAFRFIDLAGNLTIGSSRSAFSSVSLKIQNKMDPRWFESRFLQLHRFMGRQTTLDVTALYKPTPDDLSSYQNLTAQATSIAWNNGTNTLTVNLNAQTFFHKATKKLDIDKEYELPLSLENFWDPSAGKDLTITAT